MVAADQPFLEFSHTNVLLSLFVTHNYLLSEEKNDFCIKMESGGRWKSHLWKRKSIELRFDGLLSCLLLSRTAYSKQGLLLYESLFL